MSEQHPKPVTTEVLQQIQKEAAQNRSGRILSQNIEVDVLTGLPLTLQSEISNGRRVIIDYTGGVTIHNPGE